ncbi:MOSC domain-containing protein [Halarcobacter anaerophilus]|uniref:MOSC domain-containing protein n=1 Tax=Halarcobacter anaerophilus TaxID=877500 RepID=A0A4Q0XUK2_9BACT|nr:MOSC domain-containing protein [Halarcobacter anaerophilus]QDF28803.1 MOSC domain-containing protein [Halarcobacter anaerophilus]RXJ61126.1 MOSC domain-containing protein [Halarcobacter anaerophilus]
MKKMAEVLYVKVGKVTKTPLVNNKRKELVSGIKKVPVPKAFLTKTGFKEDEQADLKHHGGENKALFLFSKKTYERINKECNTDFKIDETAHFGENLILSNVCEEDICIGDIYEIGQSLIQITQPRQPCWKLSANTNKKEMTKFIFDSGYTGWYAKVLKEGTISKGDEMKFIKREEEQLTIKILNKLMANPNYDEKLTKKAIISPFLGKPFKESLEKRYKVKQKDKQFEVYHT